MIQPPSNSMPPVGSGRDGPCLFDTLAVVGVGLLGGSVALAARQRGIVRRVIGVGRTAARLQQARDANVLDEISTDLVAAAAQADLLIFATPVNLIVAGVREVASACRPGTLITDVGSTKANLCCELSAGLSNTATFIGSHPLAGSEKQGWEHSRADLFDGRVCVVTPIENSPRDEVTRLTAFWQAIGMSVVEMSPEAHDRALAQTSHVPHVVASALARTLADENRSLAATGFADTTRIAAGDPNVWVPILLDNRDAVLASLDSFSSQIAAFHEALSHGNADELRHLWEHGKAIREQLKVRRVAE
jgi:prephenate dehydrogenase